MPAGKKGRVRQKFDGSGKALNQSGGKSPRFFFSKIKLMAE
jgi:hypothetical protein